MQRVHVQEHRAPDCVLPAQNDSHSHTLLLPTAEQEHLQATYKQFTHHLVHQLATLLVIVIIAITEFSTITTTTITAIAAESTLQARLDTWRRSHQIDSAHFSPDSKHY